MSMTKITLIVGSPRKSKILLNIDENDELGGLIAKDLGKRVAELLLKFIK